jgi:hypothetical protein
VFSIEKSLKVSRLSRKTFLSISKRRKKVVIIGVLRMISRIKKVRNYPKHVKN